MLMMAMMIVCTQWIWLNIDQQTWPLRVLKVLTAFSRYLSSLPVLQLFLWKKIIRTTLFQDFFMLCHHYHSNITNLNNIVVRIYSSSSSLQIHKLLMVVGGNSLRALITICSITFLSNSNGQWGIHLSLTGTLEQIIAKSFRFDGNHVYIYLLLNWLWWWRCWWLCLLLYCLPIVSPIS